MSMNFACNGIFLSFLLCLCVVFDRGWRFSLIVRVGDMDGEQQDDGDWD